MAPRFISGSYDSLLANKYMAPILRCEAIKLQKFSSGDGLEGRILNALHQAHDLEIEGKPGYEFRIRELMSQVWMDLYELTAPLWQADQTKKNPDTIRIKEMMSYISHHYAEKTSLEQIAGAANISEREAFRCGWRFTTATNMQTFRCVSAETWHCCAACRMDDVDRIVTAPQLVWRVAYSTVYDLRTSRASAMSNGKDFESKNPVEES